jgi:sigma-B regulation protein RsbU (phosphoserine phosphatase)
VLFRSIPARTIGGDLYDFFFLDDDRLFIAIGDVSGKGVPASLFMTITRTLFRSLTGSDIPLSTTMAQVNRQLCEENPNSIFVTFITGILRISNGHLELCNAGHNLPLLCTQAGEVRTMTLHTNIPLGIDAGHVYESDRIALDPGDRIVLYTDGISEAENSGTQLFTERRLKEAVLSADRQTSRRLTAAILAEVRTFCADAEQSDDITLMVLSFLERGSSRELILKNNVAELASLKETVEKLSADWKVPQRVMMTLNLVLEELFSNIVFYGYDDNGEHQIRILFSRQSEQMVITIEDDGKPFNILESAYKGFAATLEEQEIGGEGIHLVRELMENIVYSREHGKNRVVMKKRIN